MIHVTSKKTAHWIPCVSNQIKQRQNYVTCATQPHTHLSISESYLTYFYRNQVLACGNNMLRILNWMQKHN